MNKPNLLTDFLTNDKFRIRRHFLLFFILELFAVQNTYGNFSGIGIIYANIANLLVMVAVIYFNIYLLVPKLLFKNKTIPYFLAVVVLILIEIFLLALLQGLIFQHYGINHPDIESENPYAFLSIVNAFLLLSFIIAGSTTIVFYQKWIENEAKKNNLEKGTLESELRQLKNQVNPHFLLNMLNNTNELVAENPQEASEVLSKLNDMLRYQINESVQENVYLSADIHFLTDYLNLEKIRRDRFYFTISKEGEIHNISIPPLLFIPFVENAIKHNDYSLAQPYVALSFKVLKNRLVFTCENSKTNIENKAKGGLGLENIKRRLTLLYGDQYDLKFENTTAKYSICLTLKI